MGSVMRVTTNVAVNTLDWHIRLQPKPGLDPDEERQVMNRLLTLLKPFEDSGLVLVEITRELDPEDELVKALEAVFE